MLPGLFVKRIVLLSFNPLHGENVYSTAREPPNRTEYVIARGGCGQYLIRYEFPGE